MHIFSYRYSSSRSFSCNFFSEKTNKSQLFFLIKKKNLVTFSSIRKKNLNILLLNFSFKKKTLIHFSCLSKLILSDGRDIHKKIQENLRKVTKIQENIFYSATLLQFDNAAGNFRVH